MTAASSRNAAERLAHPGAKAWNENPTPQYVWDAGFVAGYEDAVRQIRLATHAIKNGARRSTETPGSAA